MTHVLDIARPLILIDVTGIRDAELKSQIIAEMQEEDSFVLSYRPAENFLKYLIEYREHLGDPKFCLPVHGQYTYRSLNLAINYGLNKDNEFNTLPGNLNFGRFNLEASTDKEIIAMDYFKYMELLSFPDLLKVYQSVCPEAERSGIWIVDTPLTTPMLQTISNYAVVISDSEENKADHVVKSIDEFLELCESTIVPLHTRLVAK